MIGNGLPLSGFGAITVLTIEDAKAVEGIAWSTRKRFTIAASGVVDLIIDPTAFTGQIVVFQPISFDALGGPFEIDVYRGATADSDGTLIQPFNRDLSITGNGEVICRKDPNNITPGADKIMELFVPSNGTGTVATSGATSGDAIVIKLDTTKKYLIKITNTDNSAAATIGVKTDHFEVI